MRRRRWSCATRRGWARWNRREIFVRFAAGGVVVAPNRGGVGRAMRRGAAGRHAGGAGRRCRSRLSGDARRLGRSSRLRASRRRSAGAARARLLRRWRQCRDRRGRDRDARGARLGRRRRFRRRSGAGRSGARAPLDYDRRILDTACLPVILGGVGIGLADLTMLYAALADEGRVLPLRVHDGAPSPAADSVALVEPRAAPRTGPGATARDRWRSSSRPTAPRSSWSASTRLLGQELVRPIAGRAQTTTENSSPSPSGSSIETYLSGLPRTCAT